MTGDLVWFAGVEGVGAVSIIAAPDGTYDLVRTDPAGNVTQELDDVCIAERGEAENAWWCALHQLCADDNRRRRNAARDRAVDDALRGRNAHPAGKGGGHGC